MSKKSTWLFATIAHGLSAAVCIWIAAERLARSPKPSFATACAILNAVLWPVNFALSLGRYIQALEEERAKEALP